MKTAKNMPSETNTNLQTRIIGIDPGSQFTGWGILDSQTNGNLVHVASGVLKLPREKFLGLKLVFLVEKLENLLTQYQPLQGAIENIFAARYPQAALILGQARGVALYTLMKYGLPVSEYAPSQIKQCTGGSGRADKQQIQRLVQLLLNLPELPPTDAADALAIAITHATMFTNTFLNQKTQQILTK